MPVNCGAKEVVAQVKKKFLKLFFQFQLFGNLSQVVSTVKTDSLPEGSAARTAAVKTETVDTRWVYSKFRIFYVYAVYYNFFFAGFPAAPSTAWLTSRGVR